MSEETKDPKPILIREPKFVQVGLGIMLGAFCVATARSVTMAKRIVNALNAYNPNDRGY
jgi:hypothetical protein